MTVNCHPDRTCLGDVATNTGVKRRRRQREEDLERELRSHLDLDAEDRIRLPRRRPYDVDCHRRRKSSYHVKAK